MVSTLRNVSSWDLTAGPTVALPVNYQLSMNQKRVGTSTMHKGKGKPAEEAGLHARLNLKLANLQLR